MRYQKDGEGDKGKNKLIENYNKSGCYKDPIHQIMDRYVLEDVIWIHRDKNRYKRDPTTIEGYSDTDISSEGFF